VRRLQVVLLLNLGLITALAIVGLGAHSLAVLAAGADYLADAGGWYWLDPAIALVIAVIIGYHAGMLARKITLAIRSSPARPPGGRRPV
jgi:Co/Zn/Cd efflux system component